MFRGKGSIALVVLAFAGALFGIFLAVAALLR